MVFPEGGIFLSSRDWNLHRTAPEDEARHNEKLKEAIKNNLPDIISDGSIITADPNSKKPIKVSLKTLELPRIKYKDGNKGVGSGSGDEDVGDVIGKESASGKGSGQAGDKPGEHFYETEMTLDEIKELVFADLGLPNLRPKKHSELESETYIYDETRKKRSLNNLDLTKTIFENLKRNAIEKGKAEIGGIIPEDYWVRSVRKEIKKENSAVVIAMRDWSGSMDGFKKYITRAFCWWTVSFLKSQYPQVDIVFIGHDTEAHEVEEEKFFEASESGGTRCSSANQLAMDIIEERYPPEDYNVYPIHFSDGENLNLNDNELCADLIINMILMEISQYSYVQIGSRSKNDLLSTYEKLIGEDEVFMAAVIEKKEDLIKALRKIFKPQEKK